MTTAAAEHDERPHAWLAVVLLHVVSAFVMLFGLLSVPDPNGSVALVLAPGTSEQAAFDVVRKTNSQFIRFGNAPWLIVVMPERNDFDFWASAHLSGALLVINPMFVGDCAPGPAEKETANLRRL